MKIKFEIDHIDHGFQHKKTSTNGEIELSDGFDALLEEITALLEVVRLQPKYDHDSGEDKASRPPHDGTTPFP